MGKKVSEWVGDVGVLLVWLALFSTPQWVGYWRGEEVPGWMWVASCAGTFWVIVLIDVFEPSR